MSYSHRIADLQLAERLEAFGAVLIEGPKWCGKTITTVSVSTSIADTLTTFNRIGYRYRSNWKMCRRTSTKKSAYCQQYF